jgi:Domain of unknown function (DUF4258)
MDIKPIQEAVTNGNYQYSVHAAKRIIERVISVLEVVEAIEQGEIIEEYPTDKYGPSCLLYGETKQGRHLHIQVSLPPSLKIITLYEPKPAEWENYRVRKT